MRQKQKGKAVTVVLREGGGTVVPAVKLNDVAIVKYIVQAEEGSANRPVSNTFAGFDSTGGKLDSWERGTD